MKYVLGAIIKYPELAPGFKGKDQTLDSQLTKWIIKFNSGRLGKPTLRKTNIPGTIPDPMVEIVIKSRLQLLDENQVNDISWGHRIGMQAENIIGALLEEYLADNLEQYGWYCAWGASVSAVDFVSSKYSLLQVKNRDNSENSSSRKVRDDTEIMYWFRSRSTKLEFMWDRINTICGTNGELSEDRFKKFVQSCIKNNPDCVAIEIKNPWLSFNRTKS